MRTLCSVYDRGAISKAMISTPFPALSDGGKHEIMWRPGGGAYNDFSFDYIVAKSEQIGRQNAYLPPYVTINHSEVENFPYNLINKTPKSTAAEAMINMTVGCTGGAFNILPSETLEPIENIAPHLKAIADIKLFYLTLQEVTAGLSPAGIHTGWRIDAQLPCRSSAATEADSLHSRSCSSSGFPSATIKIKRQS